MKRIFGIFLLVMLTSCSFWDFAGFGPKPEINYIVDITAPSEDIFKVNVYVENLEEKNNIYNFAATAPGTYQVLDFGKYVSNFKAFNNKGGEIGVEKISTNQYKILHPGALAKITYDVEDTFDSDIRENRVAPMSGTGIQDDFITLNTFGVLGYFSDLQSVPVKVRLKYPEGWKCGTALLNDDKGWYYADNFDHLADSPFLLGELSVSATEINGIEVSVFCYTADTAYNANKILEFAGDVLRSSEEFVGYAPVTHYRFLMVLIGMDTFLKNQFNGAGALEHSYSSLYVMPLFPQVLSELRSTMAHEFMHILTPLNLHSEIIHEYNFMKPTPSKHVWLYEGVTEWVSDIMQLRSGIFDIDTYLKSVSEKLVESERFDNGMSLIELSLKSFETDGYNSFINFYLKGAVVAGLMDIRLLELSDGKKGLRDVYVDLLKEFGKDKPFPESEFIQIFINRTYPEMESFFDKYIGGNEKLPVKEYYNKLGIDYYEKKVAGKDEPVIGISLSYDADGNVIIFGAEKEAMKFGIRDQDVIVELGGEKITPQNINRALSSLKSRGVGAEYKMVISRGGKEITINGKVLRKVYKHLFDPMEKLSDSQKKLRESWMKNL